MKTILAAFFAAVLCLSLLAGCSSKKPIVGKWQGGPGQFEFTPDGKLVVTMGSVTMNGTYTLPDDGHFAAEIDFGGKKQTMTVAYTVSGDTLTTEDNGKKETLTRVK
jgi:uncharacterized protein (TIGR03066 family)